MKLYIVRLPNPVNYGEIRAVAEKVDPISIITMIEDSKVYEFHDEMGARKVAKVFGGNLETIEY